jgi:uncharacterized protein YndB with AHSA1/START domain
MAHKFEIAKDVEVAATPEQVWEAIATGPGLDSWFMGRSEVEPREGGRASWTLAGNTEESTVTTWDPPRRFVNTGDQAPDGSFHQFDYRIEDRGPGRTAIRYVHSGMLSGDWQQMYEAMNEGDPMYLHKLAQYVTYFSGRYSTPIDVFGPNVGDREHAMATFRRALGLDESVGGGDSVRLVPDGLPAVDGVVDYVSPSFLGVRSPDALFRFIYGFDGTVMVGHHLFSDGIDHAKAEDQWRSWLGRVFQPAGGGATPG